MPRPSMNGVRTHLIITKPQDKKLKQLERTTGLSKSELIRRAIDAYVKPV